METGLTIPSQVPGLVPEFEEREAATAERYTWTDWQQLPYAERVDGVAHYRLHLLISLHRQDAADRHAARPRRRK